MAVLAGLTAVGHPLPEQEHFAGALVEPHLHGRQRAAAACVEAWKCRACSFRLRWQCMCDVQVSFMGRSGLLQRAAAAGRTEGKQFNRTRCLTDQAGDAINANTLGQPEEAFQLLPATNPPQIAIPKNRPQPYHQRRLPCRTWGRRWPRPGWRKTASSARTSPCPAWLRG